MWSGKLKLMCEQYLFFFFLTQTGWRTGITTGFLLSGHKLAHCLAKKKVTIWIWDCRSKRILGSAALHGAQE